MARSIISIHLYPATGTYVAPRPPPCMIDVLSDKEGREKGKSIPNQQSSYYTLGFDGYPYPMPNDHGYGWPRPKKDTPFDKWRPSFPLVICQRRLAASYKLIPVNPTTKPSQNIRGSRNTLRKFPSRCYSYNILPCGIWLLAG